MGWTFSLLPELLRDHRPERPVLALRPRAASTPRIGSSTTPGGVLYAAKANDAPPIVEALTTSACAPSSSDDGRDRPAHGSTGAVLFHEPVKSRVAIARAYQTGGSRLRLRQRDELDKIMEETGRARDLTLFLRVACPNTHSLVPLEGKFGVWSTDAPALLLRARQLAQRLGITFHVGSQAVVPAAFGDALRQVGQLIVASGVLVDAIDIGGGFPSRYPHSNPPDLASFMAEVVQAADELRRQAFL